MTHGIHCPEILNIPGREQWSYLMLLNALKLALLGILGEIIPYQ